MLAFAVHWTARSRRTEERMLITRRRILLGAAAAVTGTLTGASRPDAAAKPTVTVYKSPT
jgi:hypothetical protein